MSTSSTLTNLPKLKGKSNYTNWSYAAEEALMSLSIWPYKTSETLATFEDRQDEWDSKDHTARAWIYANCVVEIQQLLAVSGLNTSKDVWEFLKKNYAPGEFVLYQEYITLRYHGKGIEKFCNTYKAKLRALRSTRVGINDYQAVYHFIILVSPFFETIARIRRELMRSSDYEITEFTLDDLISSLIDESRVLVNQARWAPRP